MSEHKHAQPSSAEYRKAHAALVAGLDRFGLWLKEEITVRNTAPATLMLAMLTGVMALGDAEDCPEFVQPAIQACREAVPEMAANIMKRILAGEPSVQ